MALHCACDTTTSKKWRGQTFFARCFSSVSTSSDLYTFSYGAGSDRLIGFSCRHEGVTPFIPADAYDNCNKHDDC